MNQFIVSELDFFLASFVGGVILFLAYDILNIFRNVIKHAKVIEVAEDILFWVAASILMFYMCFEFNNGILRWYAAVAFILGMKIYQILFSRIFLRFFTFILLKIKKAVLQLIALLLAPIRFLIKQVRRLFLFIYGKLLIKYKKITGAIKKQLKSKADAYKIKREDKKRKRSKGKQEPAPQLKRGVLELIPRNKGEIGEEEKKKT